MSSSVSETAKEAATDVSSSVSEVTNKKEEYIWKEFPTERIRF